MFKYIKSLLNKESQLESVVEEPLLPEPEPTPPPKYVEISEEDVQPLMDLYKSLNNSQLTLGQFMIESENRKKRLLLEFETIKEKIQDEIDVLREANGIPENDDHYSLNLPTSTQKFACFIRDQVDGDELKKPNKKKPNKT